MESCSLTGHRPSRFVFQYNESHAACVALKSKLYHTIRALYIQKGIWQYFTGCALGADLWAGEAVLSLKEQYNMIKLICVVPFEGQDRNWSEPQRLRYSRLLANSNEVITLAKVARGGSAEQYYYARNRFLVDHADLLLAVYDKETHSRTGTVNTVRYAQGQGKPILFLNPNSLKLSYEATKTNSS